MSDFELIGETKPKPGSMDRKFIVRCENMDDVFDSPDLPQIGSKHPRNADWICYRRDCEYMGNTNYAELRVVYRLGDE